MNATTLQGRGLSQGVALFGTLDPEVAAALQAVPRARDLVEKGAFRTEPW